MRRRALTTTLRTEIPRLSFAVKKLPTGCRFLRILDIST
jgi:hypothetical protein